MITDSIADLLTRVRNAQQAGHKVVRVPSSKMGKSVLNVLKGEGFIESFETAKDDRGFASFTVHLKYYENGLPMISVAERVSKPGHRKYRRVSKLPRSFSGLGISIVSTSQGVMSDREARKKKIGGEVVALVG